MLPPRVRGYSLGHRQLIIVSLASFSEKNVNKKLCLLGLLGLYSKTAGCVSEDEGLL